MAKPFSPNSSGISGYIRYIERYALALVFFFSFLFLFLSLPDNGEVTNQDCLALFLTPVSTFVSSVILVFVMLYGLANECNRFIKWLMNREPVYGQSVAASGWMADLHYRPRWCEPGKNESGHATAGQYLFACSSLDSNEKNKKKRHSGGESDDSLLTKSESKLRETRERYHRIFEQMKIGVIVHDEGGMIVEVNPALEHLLGFSQRELQFRKLTEFIHPDDAADYAHVTELASGVRDYFDVEKRLINKEGQAIWVRIVASRIEEREGTPLLIIALVDDISHRREEERLKDAFIGMVSHELKNPLMAVISSLRLAKKEGQFPEVLHELIDIASDGAESLWVILENLLEVSRAKAGHTTFSPVISDLSTLVAGVMPNIKRSLFHNLKIDIPESLPPVMVDPSGIRLILQNLVDNAIKYSPKGGDILIFARHKGREIVVGVKDEGIGIAKSDLQNIFQPFERLGMDNVSGTGLGLAVCRMLVEAHKGRIWVESERRKGSTYYFSLPVAPQETSS